jgi:hypothetical protein
MFESCSDRDLGVQAQGEVVPPLNCIQRAFFNACRRRNSGHGIDDTAPTLRRRIVTTDASVSDSSRRLAAATRSLTPAVFIIPLAPVHSAEFVHSTGPPGT